MQISRSTVHYATHHNLQQRHQLRERLKAWVGERPPDPPPPSEAGNPASAPPRSILPPSPPPTLQSNDATASEAAKFDSDEIGDLELRTIKLLFEKIFDQVFHVFDAGHDEAQAQARSEVAAAAGDAAAAETGEGWGLEYERHEIYHESEQTRVAAAGVIHTADGQAIEFQLNLEMQREFVKEDHIDLRLGDALKDPLVVNFDGTAAQLRDQKFLFDLDANGRLEEIAFVDAGSAFLALDRNGDGVVNDGSELFGPQSGNGFTELAALDADGNAWIDSADPVFDQLRLWVKDQDGNDQLQSLAEKGIGALYLNPARSEFSLKDGENQLQGQIRSTSVYLSEQGQVGTVQQVDLAV